jgi:aminoglycoside 6'-N-acetyltransferase I
MTEIAVFPIRPVTPESAEEWIRMRQALWDDEDPKELAREARAYITHGLTGLEAVLIAHAPDGSAVGFAEMNIRPYAEGCETTRVAYLEGWFVDVAWRGRRVGRALMRGCEEWARSVGCTEFASDALADNLASRDAHLSLGFEEVEVIRCFMKRL